MHFKLNKFAHIFRTAVEGLPPAKKDEEDFSLDNEEGFEMEDYMADSYIDEILEENDNWNEEEYFILEKHYILEDPETTPDVFKSLAKELLIINPNNGPINVEWVLDLMKKNQNLSDSDKRDIIDYIREQKDNVIRGLA